jgi:predicted adenine nucleotide alpha hydrolase (AANH) superfamily ATPase
MGQENEQAKRALAFKDFQVNNDLMQQAFYQQEYCGCVYSLRDTNRWRVSRGREKVERGVKFYAEFRFGCYRCLGEYGSRK